VYYNRFNKINAHALVANTYTFDRIKVPDKKRKVPG